MPGDKGQRGRKEREAERQARRDARNNAGNNPDKPVDDVRDPNLKYDIEEIERRRNWVGEQIWHAVAGGGLDIRNVTAVGNFLKNLRPEWFKGDHGIIDQKEKGRHMRRAFLGDLSEEGWGMGDNGYARAIDEYRPNWSRMVSGMTRDAASGLYNTGEGGRWFDAFGRPAVAPTPPAPAPPPVNFTPEATNTPPPTPAFYGGSTAPNAYGTTAPAPGATSNARPPTSRAPAWYSTWRF